MKLSEFNRIVNPNDEACYVIKTSTETIDNAKFADIKQPLKTQNDISLGMYIPKGLLIIEMTDGCVIDAIIKRNEQVLIAKKGAKYYIYAFSSFNKSTLNNLLACGVNANTLVYSKKGTEILLPFHSPKNILPKYKNVEIIYSNGIGELPFWLTPLRRGTSGSIDGFHFPLTENVSRLLVNHVISLASFTKDQQIDLLKLMNQYLVVNPLDDKALENLTNSLSETFLSEFMNKSEFYHDKFGDYVIKACHIKKDRKSGHLYFYNMQSNIYTDDENYLRGFITKLCPRLKNFQKEETIKYITDYLETESVDFNSEPLNIVFKNGILNLSTMEFEPMSPEHLESIRINANYDPDAHSDTADEFFHNITCGDESTQTLLYESIGYAMLKTVELQKSFMMTGSGKNGKSTFIDLVTTLLGEDNCASLSLKDMANNFRVSTLVGKLASLAADISSQPITESDLLKSVSAGDRIMLEKKYENAYEDRVFATLFFACNKLPKTPDTSEGFYRRWVIIPFNADLSNVRNAEGFNFKRKLLNQDSIDYIAYKAVNAIYKVLTETMEFTQPQSVTNMLNSYKINNSSVLSWYKERFLDNKTNPSDELKANAISRLRRLNLTNAYDNYTTWCNETNKQKLSRPNFEEEVRNQFGLTRENSSH